jgi:H+/Cl- antiporter ClcA
MSERPIPEALREELSDWRRWAARAVVLVFAALSGLSVVLLTWLGEEALELFYALQERAWWSPLLWTPLCTALVVWAVRRWCPGAGGSGIPQVLAAMEPGPSTQERRRFVSLSMSLAKILGTAGSLVAGLTVGREGPSVQVAAGVMHHARRWLPDRTAINEHGLMVAGGAAGVAAAFNTPLGGVMFAIEELTRRPEQRSSGLLMAAIVLAGLMGVSVYGNNAYFGVIQVPSLSWSLFLPGLLVALLSGLAGGLFSRLLIRSLTGMSHDRFSQWRRRFPVRFAAGCGFVVAVIGVVSHGATLGSGYQPTRLLLEGDDTTSALYVPLRFISSWLSAWSGAPGGIFAPCLAIGAGIGSDVATWTGHPAATALIALGMVGFLAAATQTPITAFIIVMEMVDGHTMVLSLMACALLASGVSRLLGPSLYTQLAAHMLGLPGNGVGHGAPTTSGPGPSCDPASTEPRAPGDDPVSDKASRPAPQ